MYSKARMEVIIQIAEPLGEGVHAAFYSYGDKLGIKVFHTRYETIKEAKESGSWIQAKDEIDNLEKARKVFPYCPKAYKRLLVKSEGYYRVVLVMDLIEGEPISYQDYEDRKFNKVRSSLYNKLKKLGIYHEDLNRGNIIKCKNKYWIVDWGDWVSFQPA